MFQLTSEEALRCQIGTSKAGRGGRRLEELERETGAKLGKHDEQLSQTFEALRQLIAPPPHPKRRVGFGLPEGD
jgi:hypothetical protein